MPAKRDRFVQTGPAKELMYGTGNVASLKPDWAKVNGIRTGLATIDNKKVRVYSVLNIAEYKERLEQERRDSALESDAVRTWRFVVDQASADDNSVAEKWANGHLLTAIAESDTGVLDVGAITLE